MWSVGAILFELLNGYPPFHGRTNVQVVTTSLILRGTYRCASSNNSNIFPFLIFYFSGTKEHKVKHLSSIFSTYPPWVKSGLS